VLYIHLTYQVFTPEMHPNHMANCTGSYYEGVNTLFIDCFDSLGNIVAQDAKYFEFSLVSECNSNMTFADISQNLTGWIIPQTVESTTPLKCCDYY